MKNNLLNKWEFNIIIILMMFIVLLNLNILNVSIEKILNMVSFNLF